MDAAIFEPSNPNKKWNPSVPCHPFVKYHLILNPGMLEL
jgi:hypothetical protein